VRFQVTKQSSEIAHRYLRIALISRLGGRKMTAVKLKGNYTYPRFQASRRRPVTQTVGLRGVVKKYVILNGGELSGERLMYDEPSVARTQTNSLRYLP
jgi:hypothetical protein